MSGRAGATGRVGAVGDHSVVGLVGQLTVATRGSGGAGEVAAWTESS
jgi:hypothetical protein